MYLLPYVDEQLRNLRILLHYYEGLADLRNSISRIYSELQEILGRHTFNLRIYHTHAVTYEHQSLGGLELTRCDWSHLNPGTGIGTRSDWPEIMPAWGGPELQFAWNTARASARFSLSHVVGIKLTGVRDPVNNPYEVGLLDTTQGMVNELIFSLKNRACPYYSYIYHGIRPQFQLVQEEFKHREISVRRKKGKRDWTSIYQLVTAPTDDWSWPQVGFVSRNCRIWLQDIKAITAP